MWPGQGHQEGNVSRGGDGRFKGAAARRDVRVAGWQSAQVRGKTWTSRLDGVHLVKTDYMLITCLRRSMGESSHQHDELVADRVRESVVLGNLCAKDAVPQHSEGEEDGNPRYAKVQHVVCSLE